MKSAMKKTGDLSVSLADEQLAHVQAAEERQGYVSQHPSRRPANEVEGTDS